MTLAASAARSSRLLLTGFYYSRVKCPETRSLVFGKMKYRTIVTRTAPEEVGNPINLTPYIKRQFDDVIASPEDRRSYRGLQLANDLKVLLISDPTTDKSAASLDVNAGHLNDPHELPGLAHFCEHMLFLGTEKYPVENEYQKYLSTHGGGSNAYTACDHTNYHFDVAPEFLNGAVDRNGLFLSFRFAQFFIGPLFTESCTEREVCAVDSEHSNNVQNDDWRFCQLERSLSKQTHAYSKFGTGNRKTLLEDARAKNLDPRRELLKFHDENYSSNLMCLAAGSHGDILRNIYPTYMSRHIRDIRKESLDELAQMVVPIFAKIPNKNLTAPEWPEHPYGSEQLGHRIDVVPVKDLRSLHAYFPIPDLHPHYKSNPGHYVSHLLGHEGEGSLLSELKRKGWVNGLSAGPQISAKGFGFFNVDFELSEEGLDHVDDIVHLMFKYIQMMKVGGPQEWIHREVESLGKIQFRFQDKNRPQNYVTAISTALHYYPLKEVLYAPYMMPDYKPELIAKLLNMLTIDNVGISVISQKFKGKSLSSLMPYSAYDDLRGGEGLADIFPPPAIKLLRTTH
uniref:Insulin-degrading enzyme n=1 Tax=Romanomermis culicivorax TaxID=13658 RepID=A0A915HZ04_ROMCU